LTVYLSIKEVEIFQPKMVPWLCMNLSCHFYTYQGICTVHYYRMFKFNLHKLIYTNFADCNNYMKKISKNWVLFLKDFSYLWCQPILVRWRSNSLPWYCAASPSVCDARMGDTLQACMNKNRLTEVNWDVYCYDNMNNTHVTG